MMTALFLASAMMTPWGEKVTSENCWREYPRPQMVRAHWTCLNGDWDYAVTGVTNTLGRPLKLDGKIRVPFAFDITDYVKPSVNELTVCVWDPTEGHLNSHGKQCLSPRGCIARSLIP